MRFLVARRPEFLLLAALALFAMVLAVRLAPQPIAPSTPTQMSPLTAGDTEHTITVLKARVRDNPNDAAGNAQLGLALLQRVRETADVDLYAQAQQALDAALASDRKNVDALIGQGTLALARHQFAAALRWGQQARAIDPYRAAAYGVIGDAYTELGQYDEAANAIDTMVATRPDLGSYSRIAYQRELRGDVDGAAQALQLAISAGGPATENSVWAQVQLGNLLFGAGRINDAEQVYLEALSTSPDNAYAAAGVARVRAAQGQFSTAIGIYKQIVERLPLPEFAIALGDLYQLTGQQTKADQQFALVRVIEQLQTAAGVDTDVELALFDADHQGDSTATVERARAAYQRRPSITGADALAWALYRNGSYEEARQLSEHALHLGTRDAMLHYHAAMIAHALGDDSTAITYLQTTLAINPHFSLRYAGAAQALLVELQQKEAHQ